MVVQTGTGGKEHRATCFSALLRRRAWSGLRTLPKSGNRENRLCFRATIDRRENTFFWASIDHRENHFGFHVFSTIGGNPFCVQPIADHRGHRFWSTLPPRKTVFISPSPRKEESEWSPFHCSSRKSFFVLSFLRLVGAAFLR